jgi:hypothetical protein
LGSLLDTLPASNAIGDSRQRTAVANLWVSSTRRDDEFWSKVAAIGLTKSQVSALKTTIALNDLAGGNMKLIKALQARTPGNPDGTLSYLTTLNRSQWIEISAQAAEDGDSLAKIELAAAGLQRQVQRQYPSASFKAGLDNSTLKIDHYPTKEVSGFLGKYQEFDLRDTDIEPFLLEQKLNDDDSVCCDWEQLMRKQLICSMVGSIRRTR